MEKVSERIDGVVIGQFLGFDGGVPLVVYPGNPDEEAQAAKSLTTLSPDMIGSQVALLFESGDPSKPLIVGRIVEPVKALPTPEVIRDGERVKIVGNERIELRCGKASILMDKDGHITIRGTYVTSQASASNRIRGGSIDLN
jgi:hypothetical protein